LLEVSRYLHLNPVRGMVLGQGTPMERQERLREYRWSSYQNCAGLEKRKSFLDIEPIQSFTMEHPKSIEIIPFEGPRDLAIVTARPPRVHPLFDKDDLSSFANISSPE
jgi:hypothetical protein